ncbi:MAG: YhbY family RNA-binding protein [Candidatus Woesearchaeota archaeon]
MNSLQKKEYIEQSHSLKPILQIGKQAITPAVVEELSKHLKKRKLIKVKFLKNCLDEFDKQSLCQEICQKTGATLVRSIGNIVILHKQ